MDCCTLKTAQKNKNVVRVQVDGVYSKVGVGVEGVSDTDTNDPLYIGGVPSTYLYGYCLLIHILNHYISHYFCNFCLPKMSGTKQD